VLGLVFPYQARRLAWGTSPKWPVLCRVGRITGTQSINQSIIMDRSDAVFVLVFCDRVLVRKAVLSGLSAGAMAQFIASPTDLIKVHMQMEGRRRLDGKPPRYCLSCLVVYFYCKT